MDAVVDPALDPVVRGLDRAVVLDRLTEQLAALPVGTVRRLAQELVTDIRALTVRINDLER